MWVEGEFLWRFLVKRAHLHAYIYTYTYHMHAYKQQSMIWHFPKYTYTDMSARYLQCCPIPNVAFCHSCSGHVFERACGKDAIECCRSETRILIICVHGQIPHGLDYVLCICACCCLKPPFVVFVAVFVWLMACTAIMSVLCVTVQCTWPCKYVSRSCVHGFYTVCICARVSWARFHLL